MTLAVNFGTTLFLVGCLNIFENDNVGITENFQTYQTWLVFLVITLLTHATSAFGNRWLSWLDGFAIFCTMAGLAVMTTCLLAIAKHGRRSAAWTFGNYQPQAQWPAGWSFFIGLLHAAYATSATGMVMSLCEEVREPAVMVPRAMVGTILINTVAGLTFLIPVCFVMPDLTILINSDQPVPVIFKSAIGNDAGAFCLTIPILVLGVICSIGCVTVTSRCIWAFARDGGIPGSGWWRRIDKRRGVPLNANALGIVVELGLGAIYFGSSAAFHVFAGAAVIFLTTSYACPIAVPLIFRRRRDIKKGTFDFDIFGFIANVFALAWSILAIPLFCMPAVESITLQTMNYASVVFVGFIAIAAVWYAIWGYHNYRGPPTHAIERDDDSLSGTPAEFPEKIQDP